MSGLSYKKYYFIGNALTEEQFLDLKYLLQTNRSLVEQNYKVNYLKEIFQEFKISFLLLLIGGTAFGLALTFIPNPGEWLEIVLTVLGFVVFFGCLSLVISMFNFLSYLGKKRHYGTLHLSLLENCSDFRNYMDNYLKHAS